MERFTALTAGCAFLFASSLQCFALDRTITVSGTAHMDVAPDHATLTIGVTTNGNTVAEALSKNAPVMKAVLQAIEEAGASAKNISTSSFEIAPTYERLPNGGWDTSRTTGYSANNDLNVSLSALDRVGKVIDAAARAGATNTGQISFSLENDAALLNHVRADAMRDARQKAEAVVAPEHKRVGELLVVGRGVSGLDEYAPTRGYSSSPVTAVGQQEMKFESQIVPGHITISDTVLATFALQ